MLHLLRALAPARRWRLCVAHCDHGWRADSHANAAHVRRLARRRWRLPFLLRAAPDPAAIGTEAAARAWRYGALLDMARRARCEVVATGHTLSDAAETLLLNLARGAGPRGMTALRAARRLRAGAARGGLGGGGREAWMWRRLVHRAARSRDGGLAGCWAGAAGAFGHGWHGRLRVARRAPAVALLPRRRRERGCSSGVTVVRPLLGVTREETAAVCARERLPVYLDSTNEDAGVSRRNRLRLEVVPALRACFGAGVEGALVRAGRRAVAAATAAARLARRELLAPQFCGRAGLLEAATWPAGLDAARAAVLRLALRRCEAALLLLVAGGGAQARPEMAWRLASVLARRKGVLALPPGVRRAAVRAWLAHAAGLLRSRSRAWVAYDAVEAALQLRRAPNRAATSTLARACVSGAVLRATCLRDGGAPSVREEEAAAMHDCDVSVLVNRGQLVLALRW